MTLQGQGATPERLLKSKVIRKVRGTTRGGIPDSYGHEDSEHCTLDILYNKGFIEDDQRDAGFELRELYFSFNYSSHELEKRGAKGHDGDYETEADRAEARYHQALRENSYPKLTRTICIEETYVPADYNLIQEIQRGLDDLLKFFKKS